jgi:hypothetical protein
MRGETILNKADLETVTYFVNHRKFGDALQDLYLLDFYTYLSDQYNSRGMKKPAIVCDPYDFTFTDHIKAPYQERAYTPGCNMRTIIDLFNPKNDPNDLSVSLDVHVFFDYPNIPSSALYFGTFNKDMRSVIMGALEKMRANYKTTPFGLTPFTAKVDMTSFGNGEFSRTHQIQSLEYINVLNSIVQPEQLFDVVNTESDSSL